MKQMHISGMSESVEDKENDFCLVFRAMGTDLDKIITKDIKAKMLLCRNSSLTWIWKREKIHVPSRPMTAELICQDELGHIKDREWKWSQD